MFVRKIRAFNIDEIDGRLQRNKDFNLIVQRMTLYCYVEVTRSLLTKYRGKQRSNG